MNPNNCATCRHKAYPEGGFCYMFRNEPEDVCMQHTCRRVPLGIGLTSNKSMSKIIEEFIHDQEPLGDDFQKVLHGNLSDLYESENSA